MLSRVPRGHHCWRRAYSSLVEEAQASSVAAISSRWPQPYRPNELPDNGPDAERRAYRNQDRDLHMKAKGMDQVINVKLPNEIGGLPHAFAILRAIEKKYGPILDHSFRRSFITSRPDDYRSNVQVSIANSDAHDRLRHEGEDMLEVPLARFDRERPGGAGLEDILPILLHQSRDEPSLYSDHTVVIKVSADSSINNINRLSNRPDLSNSWRRHIAMADAFATWDGFYTGPPGPYKSSALDKCRSLLKPARYNSIMSSNAASLPEKPAQAPSSEPEPSLAQAPASEPGPEPELVEIRPSHPPEQVPTLADVMAARTQTRVTAAKAQTRIAQTAAAAPPRASSPSPVTSRPISKTKASKEDAFAKKQRELLQRQKKFSKDIATGPKKKAKEKVQQVGEEPPKQRGFLSALFQRWL